MKKILFSVIMAVMLATAVSSCSKSDDDNPKNYATESEIQGKWGCVLSHASYQLTFSKPNYTLIVISGKETKIESGTYTMGASGTITLKTSDGKESIFSPLEAYWEGPGKTLLHFYPIGNFLKM